jgi:pimeloyl-ACP methyl ester carboxylesterase
LTVARPDLVTGLVLISPALPGWDHSLEMEAYGDQEDAALERGDLDEAVALNLRMWLDGAGRERAEVSDERRAALATMLRRSFEHIVELGEDDGEDYLVADLRERLGEIAVPAVVLVGEHDVADFHGIADHLATQLADVEVRELPGVAHAPNYEDPEGFNPVLAEALDRVG